MLELLYEALASPLGVEVTTNNPERLRQQLYGLRAKSDDPALQALSFVIPTKPETLWIVKRPA